MLRRVVGNAPFNLMVNRAQRDQTVSHWKYEKAPRDRYSRFPAVITLMAMIMVISALIYMEGLEGRHNTTRVFVPTDETDRINLKKAPELDLRRFAVIDCETGGCI